MRVVACPVPNDAGAASRPRTESPVMIARLLDSLCNRALASQSVGSAVRSVILLGSRDAPVSGGSVAPSR